MKTFLRISVLANLVLLGGVFCLLKDPHEEKTTPESASSETKATTPTAVFHIKAATPEKRPERFRWSRLESSKNYRVYIANLRAIGCPEATIEDIVRGDVDRAFSWERNQLGLDGSGSGPWSRSQERRLVASLLNPQLPVEGAGSAQGAESQMADNNDSGTTGDAAPQHGEANQAEENPVGEAAQASVPTKRALVPTPSYPLFLQHVNWDALGFTASQQEAIAQVRQQFLSTVSSPNQDPGDAAGQNPNPSNANTTTANSNPNGLANLTQWQKAMQNANGQLHDLLGSQGYEAYEQQQYWYWYQPQAVAANAEGDPLSLDLNAFSVK